MKTQTIVLSFLFVFGFFSGSWAQSSRKDTMRVWGNCDMCKKTIEKAAKKAGAAEVDWNIETKILSVSYHPDSTSSQKIQEAIAASGYDTQDFKATDEAYHKLPGCCQYKRKGSVAEIKKESCCSNETCVKDGCKDKSTCKQKTCCKS